MRDKPPKEVRDRRKQGRPRKTKPDKPKAGLDWKFLLAIALAIAGLLLTALGYRARPTVSLDAPLNPDDVITTPFVIANDGTLALNDVRVNPYVRRMGTVTDSWLEDGGGDEYMPPTKTLEPGEKRTVPFKEVVRFGAPLKYADIALIVSFRPAYLPFWQKERAFRFVTAQQADGRLRFVPQPAGDSLDRFKFLQKAAQSIK